MSIKTKNLKTLPNSFDIGNNMNQFSGGKYFNVSFRSPLKINI